MTVKTILHQFDEKLKAAKTYRKENLETAKQCIILCRNTLRKLRKIIVENGFESVEKEITFFKALKQQPLTQLFYYKEVYEFEMTFPKGSKARQKKLLEHKLRACDKFILQHIDFYQYMEMCATHLDAYYFTRSKQDYISLGLNGMSFQDNDFNTPKDMLFAKISAYQLFIQFLKKRQMQIEGRLPIKNFKLYCTVTKTDIIELIYALWASKAIKGDIKELAMAFEMIFQIELGDLYRTFIAIRGRTKDPTRFLDALKIALLKKIEQADA